MFQNPGFWAVPGVESIVCGRYDGERGGRKWSGAEEWRMFKYLDLVLRVRWS